MEIKLEDTKVLKTDIDKSQLELAQRFMLFIGGEMVNLGNTFEENFSCSPEEMKVFELLAQHGPMMVKEIADGLNDISTGSLSRLLDRLEVEGYIVRKTNLKDRRSLQIMPTSKAEAMLNYRSEVMLAMAQQMLQALTPTERLILIELYSKIEANWHSNPEQA